MKRLTEIPYDRGAAVRYAHTWAYCRNPRYFNYDGIGGDCTNFASQCLYAGTGVMNFTPIYGWYYLDPNDKAPAWTGVPYFRNFLVRSKPSPGPFAREVSLEEVEPGDFIQLRFDKERFTHTPIVVEVGSPAAPDNILVAAHSDDTDFCPLDRYDCRAMRCLHVLGAWKREGNQEK